MSDRAFTIAFSLSLGLHLVLLAGQWLSLFWHAPVRSSRPIDVIYEAQAARREMERLQEQLVRAKRNAMTSAGGANISSRRLGELTQIRIPDRPVLTQDQELDDILPGRAAVVDLANLAEAAGGNPVLLSYFSVIRERIQQTASNRGWFSEEINEGLVYVSFVLTAEGAVRQTGIVSSRSAPSPLLRDVAVRIVQAAGPFPPFPPSITEPSKTIVVPLEFLLGT